MTNSISPACNAVYQEMDNAIDNGYGKNLLAMTDRQIVDDLRRYCDAAEDVKPQTLMRYVRQWRAAPVTPTQAAKLLGCTGHFVRYLIRKGKLPAEPRTDLNGQKVYLITKQDLATFAATWKPVHPTKREMDT